MTIVAAIVLALVVPVLVATARHGPSVEQQHVVGTWTGTGGGAREALGRPGAAAGSRPADAAPRPRRAQPPRARTASFVWPVGGPWAITSPFGLRGEEGDQMHHGLDIGCGLGTPVVAALPGRVTFAGDAGAYGNTVLLDHGNSWMTLYAHLDGIDVANGSWAGPKQVIGRCGSTGRSTGPHLHLEIRYGGHVWDPLHYLP